MNKKLNTFIFIICASLFNVLIAIISFLFLLFLYSRFLVPVISDSANAFGFFLIFILSIAISFIVYRKLIHYLMKKVDFDKYFDPIFRHKPKR